jgi:hypothetical protein
MSAIDPSAPEPPPPLDKICEAALAYAKRWNLVCDNGQIVCSRKDCGLEATLPSLLCAGHLASAERLRR